MSDRNMIFVGAVIVLVMIAWYYVSIWRPFKAELDYLRMERERNFDIKRRKRFEKQIRTHYLKCIPIVRWFI